MSGKKKDHKKDEFKKSCETEFFKALKNTSRTTKGQIEKEEPISFYNFSIICVQFIYSRRTCFLVFFDVCIKVQLFWEGHENLKLLSKRQIKWVITLNFCGLLRKAELYCAFASEKCSLLYSFIARFEKFLDDIWQE